ncbi:sigma-70 family RNA polymerase sigma factor [Actinoplanes sp. NPDC051470]|uniref:RNA polymerase sigma factor n=1 Tax=Actinoplanes sp. NPDC051470 TaxID=3157224 RepID=UPI003421CED6
MGGEHETVLLARAAAGDARAFADLVTPYRNRVWAVCLRITADRDDADDALQDALTAAWRNLGGFRAESRFGTWLHRIAANAALALVRRRRDTPAEDHVLDRPVEVDAYAAVDEADRIAAAVRLLPDDFRVAFVLREYADLTYEEIAAHQDIGVQTVKSRLNRARRAVAAALGVPEAVPPR